MRKLLKALWGETNREVKTGEPKEQPLTNKEGHGATSRPVESKRTFIFPYLILTGLMLPNLMVLMYVKPTAGFDALAFSGWLAVLSFVIGAMLVLASLCTVIYLIRAHGKASRLIVLALTVAMWGSFVYVLRDAEASVNTSNDVDISNTL